MNVFIKMSLVPCPSMAATLYVLLHLLLSIVHVPLLWLRCATISNFKLLAFVTKF